MDEIDMEPREGEKYGVNLSSHGITSLAPSNRMEGFSGLIILNYYQITNMDFVTIKQNLEYYLHKSLLLESIKPARTLTEIFTTTST